MLSECDDEISDLCYLIMESKDKFLTSIMNAQIKNKIFKK